MLRALSLSRESNLWETTDKPNKMDDPQNHFTEWKKPDTKEYILCDCTDRVLRLKKLMDRKRNQNRVCLWECTERKEAWCTFCGDKNNLYLDRGLGCMMDASVKTHWIILLKSVHFTVCKLYPNQKKKKEKRNVTTSDLVQVELWSFSIRNIQSFTMVIQASFYLESGS